jgi:hypothetical protein
MMHIDATNFEIILSVALGLGLAAACGFRIFVPMLALSAASLADLVPLADSFAWVGTPAAFIIFAAATVLEVGGYFIPWVDNFLDSIGAPVAVVAGTLVTASAVTGMDPMLKWSLALIAGGGAAAAVHGSLSVLRAASTATTGGLGNPLISAAEAGGSLAVSALAILIPFAGAVIFFLLLVVGLWLARVFRRRSARRRETLPARI